VILQPRCGAIGNVGPAAHYFVFSDQPGAVCERIPFPHDRVTQPLNTGDELAYAELWLMTQCQPLIIANSTFSWWVS
jgi:hypothetical protein